MNFRESETYKGIVVAVMTTRLLQGCEIREKVHFSFVLLLLPFRGFFRGEATGKNRALEEEEEEEEEGKLCVRPWPDEAVVMRLCDDETRPWEWHDERAMNEEGRTEDPQRQRDRDREKKQQR